MKSTKRSILTFNFMIPILLLFCFSLALAQGQESAIQTTNVTAVPIEVKPILVQQDNISAGITPDSKLWSIDRLFEKITLIFLGPEGKLRKQAEIAQERIAEAEVMVKEGKMYEAQLATDEVTLKLKEEIIQQLDAIEEEPEIELELEIEIEKRIAEIEDSLANFNEIEIEAEVSGELSGEQLSQLREIIKLLSAFSSGLKVEIESKKDSTKIKIKAEGKTDEEIEEIEERIEEKKGLKEERMEEAMEGIEELNEEIAELKSDFEISQSKEIEVLIREAEDKLAKAREAFEGENYNNALGLINAGMQIIENAAAKAEEEEISEEAEEEEETVEEEEEIEGTEEESESEEAEGNGGDAADGNGDNGGDGNGGDAADGNGANGEE